MSDLTDSGTYIFCPTRQCVSQQRFKNLFADKGMIYFTTDSANTGFELWRTDGTVAGTGMLTDICQGPCGSEPGNFYRSDTILFFSAYDDTHGNELWSIGSNVTFLQKITSRGEKELHLDPLKKKLDQLRQTGSDIVYIKIFDLGGNELYTQFIKDPNQISSETFKPGMYVLRAYDKHDEAVAFARFVKE
jgi:ELWxxDGT repeat protein